MTLIYIDSHVNLHAPQFDEDREEVIIRAREAGVGVMVNICDRLSNFEKVLGVSEHDQDIWVTVGTHPHESKENPYLLASDITALTDHPKVIGIGECGLDFHYDFSPRSVQESVFTAHIEASSLSGLPLVIHTREADDRTLSILKEAKQTLSFEFLMHCYTSGSALARWAADEGGYFSVSGIATFKSAQAVRDIIKTMPQDRIIVETDCPYLAPVPLRGRRCEPAHIVHIIKALAEIMGWSVDRTVEITNSAFYRLFPKIGVTCP